MKCVLNISCISVTSIDHGDDCQSLSWNGSSIESGFAEKTIRVLMIHVCSQEIEVINARPRETSNALLVEIRVTSSRIILIRTQDTLCFKTDKLSARSLVGKYIENSRKNIIIRLPRSDRK